MIHYEVEFKGLDEQIAKMGQYDEIVERRFKRAMSDSVKGVARLTRVNAPGSIAGKVGSRVTSSVAGGVVGSVDVKDFRSAWVEFGTKAHGVPSSALVQWMRVDKGTAYLISRRIKRRGTRGRHYMWRGYKSFERAIKRYFDAAIKKIVQDLKVNDAN